MEEATCQASHETAKDFCMSAALQECHSVCMLPNPQGVEGLLVPSSTIQGRGSVAADLAKSKAQTGSSTKAVRGWRRHLLDEGRSRGDIPSFTWVLNNEGGTAVTAN